MLQALQWFRNELPKIVAVLIFCTAYALLACLAFTHPDKQFFLVCACLLVSLISLGLSLSAIIYLIAKGMVPQLQQMKLVELNNKPRQTIDPFVNLKPKKQHIDEDFLEIEKELEAQKIADNATDLLFGGKKENLKDSLF